VLVVIAVAAVLAGPVQVMGRRAFWRSIVELHLAAVATLVFVILVPALGLAAIRYLPEAAPWLAGGAVAATAVFAFLSRPGRGVRGRWPAGSLGWWGSVLSLVDPGEYARRAERHGRVFKIRQMHRPTVCLADLVEGSRLFRQEHEALGPATLPYNDVVPGGFVRYLRGEDHRARRAALRPAFSRSAVSEMEPALRSSIHASMAAFAKQGPWHPREIETPVLSAMIVAYLGPEASDALRDSTADLVRALASGKERDLRALMDHLSNQGSSPSVMSKLAERLGGSTEAERTDRADRSQRAARTDREKILANATFMLHLGWRDLSGLAAWLVAECARRPELLAEVHDRPALAAAVVDETLRLRQSEYLYRKATRDIELNDHVIPKGWLVRVCVREAHRSSDHFPDAREFDATRFDPACPHDAPEPGRYQPFGVDHHSCIGEDITRTIGRLLVEELSGYDLSLVRDAPSAAGRRHWRHVAPGSRMRVLLRATRDA
jgi:cytochrome P450